MSVKNNYYKVLKRIHLAEKLYSSKVHLLAVSKRHSIEKIHEAYALGQKSFGESYVNEGVDKILLLKRLDIDWHFIGPLQSNKSKLVAEHFDWIHSVDSLKLLTRLNSQRSELEKPLNCLLQFNVSKEPQKRGLNAEQIIELAEKIGKFPNLCLRGIMSIPKRSDDISIQVNDFDKCKNLFDKLNHIESVDTLSMGMSSDLELAIKSGSNMIRVGTDIFGTRE